MNFFSTAMEAVDVILSVEEGFQFKGACGSTAVFVVFARCGGGGVNLR